ncbi:MAG: T9SS type A sorting domain-containing protein [Saprospiraceae bacterium]|nr:T9SS type A sorting domain-containing protein [Saprospiraceae bacterium]
MNLALISHQTGGYNKVHIVKFDEDLNQVWHWTADNVDYIQKPYICELHDGRLVVTVSDHVAPKIASLEAINPDKSRSWKYRFPDISGKIQRRVYRIKTLKNGDIVGMGSYGNNSLILDARIPEIPYIFRMSSEGKLLWEKAFYRTRPVVDHCIGSIHDVTEAENGDLIAVGRIDNYLEYDPVVFQGRPDPDILIIRMDANGCIDPKCETITKIERTVSTTQHHETTGYNAFFFPNPSDGSMELMNHTEVASVSVFDLNGSLVIRQADPGRSLDLTGLPPGLYIAHLTLKDNKVIKQKMVVR